MPFTWFIFVWLNILSARAGEDLSNRSKTDWPAYLGNNSRDHYSSLQQIDTSNVAQLVPVWEYATGDTSGQMQCNPIIIDGVLYGTTAAVEVFALDAATGRCRWRFRQAREEAWFNTNRGVTYWRDGLQARILFSVGPWLYALDAATGEPIPGFGNQGRVSLKAGLGPRAQNRFVVATSPGVVFADLYITGTRVAEGSDAAPGHIQAFDVRSGQLRWVFHTIPQPGEYGYHTWPPGAYRTAGGANAWAGLSLDEARGMVYVPTGSAAFDFYGGNRLGSNLFANCLLALDARTGKRIWHQQLVHHDLWDRDLPAPPTLGTLTNQAGVHREVAIQPTKQGFVFVFDRQTGLPIFPVEEIAVPPSTLAGEKAWPTQPRPTLPPALVRQAFPAADINPHSRHQDALLERWQSLKKGHLFEPPSKQGTLIFPGFDGGAEWGGAALDPAGTLYLNANEMPWVHTMTDQPNAQQASALASGARLYLTRCANCHGAERKGDPTGAYPALVDLEKRYEPTRLQMLIKSGRGMMPGFPDLSGKNLAALTNYLLGREPQSKRNTLRDVKGAIPYGFTGYHRFVDPDGYPAIRPPWGTLTAIDLVKGQLRWQVPLGEFPELLARGIPPTGTENYGGPLVTAGNILFIAATRDEYFRAFHTRNGAELWRTRLPAGGYATPATYAVAGRQYVVIACGGGKLGTKKGDRYLAFALPQP